MGINRAKYAKFDNIIRRVNYWNECDPGTPKRWGLCFMFNMEDLEGRRRDGSLTWAGLRNTYFWIDPVADLIAIFFTQFMPSRTYAIRSDLRPLVYQAMVLD